MAHAGHHDDHAHGPPKGVMRWLTTTNHKDIGTMYLVFSLLMFLIGGTFAFAIRAELFQPGLQLLNPAFFNQMTTMHALVMVFGAVMPATVGLANWMIPMQIGAPDMALPRMNLFSFWLLAFAFLLLLSTFLMPGGAPASGWTLYPPLVLQTGEAFPMAIFAIHLMGASSIMGAINVIVTIVNMRAPGMTLLKMPLFSWAWLITATAAATSASRSIRRDAVVTSVSASSSIESCLSSSSWPDRGVCASARPAKEAMRATAISHGIVGWGHQTLSPARESHS